MRLHPILPQNRLPNHQMNQQLNQQQNQHDSPSSFEDSENSSTASVSNTEQITHKTRLYRNTDDAVIAGVASGVAAYFGWELLMLIKRIEPENKKVPVYHLTEKGHDLKPIVVEVSLWADKYFSISGEISKQIQKYKDEKYL